jgi:hypothetical protein
MDVGEDGIDVGDLEPGLLGEREFKGWVGREGEGGRRVGWDTICRRSVVGGTAPGWFIPSFVVEDMGEQVDQVMVVGRKTTRTWVAMGPRSLPHPTGRLSFLSATHRPRLDILAHRLRQ